VKLAILALLLTSLLAGCDSAVQPEPRPKAHPKMLSHLDTQLNVFDMQMVRTNTISTNGDERPFWDVSGRIQNNTAYFIQEVWIEVHIYDKKTMNEQDSTVIKLEDLRLPPMEGVVTFSREIQLLPPSTRWTWSYEVIHAETEPRYSDIDQ